LLASCYIIGTTDKAPVHDINEVNAVEEEDDEFKGIPEEELTIEQLEKRKE
jgi:hypothetical protein